MSRSKVILITGVAGYWGAQLAKRLLSGCEPEGQAEWHILGLDSTFPDPEIRGLDFIQAELRNPLLVELLQEEQVDTVCHLILDDPLRYGEATFDANVIAAIKLLGACARAGVRKVVLKSNMMVYGAHPENPAFLTEEHALQGNRKDGVTRNLVEIENFYNGFQRQVPEMIQTVLRFPGILGLRADTPLSRFLRQPLSPVLLGFDPMMQVIHEQDVLDALVHALLHDVPGVFNIASEGVLPLSKLMAIAGKIPLPLLHPLAYLGSGLLDGVHLGRQRYLPIELDYLRYSWVGDLTKMRAEFGFVPRFTAEEVLREFAGQQRMQRFMPQSTVLTLDEQRLRDTLERRRRDRVRQAESAVEAGVAENMEDEGNE